MSIGIILGLIIFFGIPLLKMISVLFMESINGIGKAIFIILMIIAFLGIPWVSIPVAILVYFLKREC